MGIKAVHSVFTVCSYLMLDKFFIWKSKEVYIFYFGDRLLWGTHAI